MMNGVSFLIRLVVVLLMLTGLPRGLQAGKVPDTERTTRVLSLKEAFELGVENNRAVQSERFQPLQAEEDYNKARSIYDPSIFMVSSAERSARPIQSFLDGVTSESALQEDRWQIQAGLKSRLPTGGSLSLYQEGSRLDSTSSYVTPNPQYQSKLIAMWNQPLLKGLGDKEGATSIAVADLNRQIAKSAFVKNVSDILIEIASSYWQLYFEQNVVRVNRESYERAVEVYRHEKSRSDLGLNKPVDTDRALGAMKTRRSNLLRSENQARVTMRQLWLLLYPDKMVAPGDIPVLEIRNLPPLQFSSLMRDEVLSSALNQRQDLSIASDAVEIIRRQQSLARHNQLPVLDLKLNYGFNALDDDQSGLETDPYDDEYNDWRAELSFEWPWGGRSAAAEKRKADYRLKQARTDMRLTAERIALEVDIVLDELRLAKEELDATRTAMDAAKRVMEGEAALFELGQKDNQDLLTVQDYYGAAEKDFLRALSRYNLNLISVSRVQGTLLSDYKLTDKVSKN